MTHVVIRCDASPVGGIGHMVRAVSVANTARDAGYSVALAGTIGSAFARELVDAAGLELVEAPADLGILAAEQGAAIVHVDDYAVGADAAAQVHGAGAVLSSMEDGVFGRRTADVVVDSTVGAERLGRGYDGSGTVLRGVAYAPMRAQVLAAREKRAAQPRKVDGTVDVLVVMGGTDAKGAVATIAAVCRAAEGVGRVTAVVPTSNWDVVRRETGRGVELVAPSLDFLDRAAEAGLVISAAGTTAWELACIGVPSLLVAVVDNQRAGLDAAVDAGIALGLGTLEEVRADPGAATARVSAAVASLRAGADWAYRGLAVVDGLGAERIVTAWRHALAGRIGQPDAHVAARRAVPGDALLLLRWRNDPGTRAVSRSTATVGWVEHSAWFERALADPTRELYVAERGGVPVGTVRFDLHDGDEWETSITLAPEARGRGLARSVLTAGESAFLRRHTGVALVAAILPQNTASQRLFQRAGYAPDPARRDGDFDLFIRTTPRDEGIGTQ